MNADFISLNSCHVLQTFISCQYTPVASFETLIIKLVLWTEMKKPYKQEYKGK